MDGLDLLRWMPVDAPGSKIPSFLIHRFGIQVPGGSSVLAWCYAVSDACAGMAVWAEVGQGTATRLTLENAEPPGRAFWSSAIACCTVGCRYGAAICRARWAGHDLRWRHGCRDHGGGCRTGHRGGLLRMSHVPARPLLAGVWHAACYPSPPGPLARSQRQLAGGGRRAVPLDQLDPAIRFAGHQ
jgi:hypothetical protein